MFRFGKRFRSGSEVYIPEGVKVSCPVMEEVKVPEGGDVGSEEDATWFESSGIDGLWELREAFIGHANPAVATSRLFSMATAAMSNECKDRAKAIG